MILEVYSDGGLIGTSNPCPFGGTWAFTHIGQRGVITKQSGVILAKSEEWPKDVVTNNISEYYAILRALVSLPDEWSGPFFTDSRIAREWIFGHTPAPVVKHWAEMLAHTKRRLGKIDAKLLAGHPSERALVLGTNSNGNPVSCYNVLCDNLCREEAMKWRKVMGIPVSKKSKVMKHA